MKDLNNNLCELCDSLYDITLSPAFSKLSETDRRIILDAYGRLKRRLNKAGITTKEDHAE